MSTMVEEERMNTGNPGTSLDSPVMAVEKQAGGPLGDVP